VRTCAVLMLLAATTLLPAACSSETYNKNTNWLVACSSSAECGDASCVCGICTKSCSASEACAANAGLCSSDFAASTQCSVATPALCLAACTVASDCDAGHTCVAGSCVVDASDTCAAHPNALACSGFDEPAPAGWTASIRTGGTLGTVADPRLAGASALDARTTLTGGQSRFASEFATMTAGQLYLRAWLYVAPGTVLNDVHPIVIGDVSKADYGSKFLFSNGKLGVATSNSAVTGSIDAPFGQWYCLRMELEIGTQGSIRAYLNDAPFVDATAIDTLPAGNVHDISVGIDFSGQTDPAEIFVDQVLLDTAPVTCWD